MSTDELRRLKVLYDLRIKQYSIKSIVEKHGVHRNTVRNIKNGYNHISDDEIIKYYNEIQSSVSDNAFENVQIFKKKRKQKVAESDIDTIEKLCKTHLNCYLSPEELAKKLCKKMGIGFDYVKNYNPANIDTNEYYGNARRDFREMVYYVRCRKTPSKNYNEVYSIYLHEVNECEKECVDKKISYQCFYLYAREFWKDVNWGNKTLGELIDE